MLRYAVAFVLCQIAFADIADFSASAMWSFTSTGLQWSKRFLGFRNGQRNIEFLMFCFHWAL
jgi:hypothetical protein